MLRPGTPPDETSRIRALRELLILDTAPEERFDAITRYCCSRFMVDIALVSLVDSGRQWFKSACGLGVRETPRDISFCGHAILGDGVLEVPDATRDGRFADNPLVTAPPGIRFYAGAPLRMAGGHKAGTLCLIHRAPRRLAAEELDHLRLLAQVVALELARPIRVGELEPVPQSGG